MGVGFLHDVQEQVQNRYLVGSESERSRFYRPVASSEFAVVPDQSVPFRPGFFAADGDSGAPVRLADGSLVGFVRGRAHWKLWTDCVTYVEPAETVLKSIAEATGAKEATFIPCWDQEAKQDGTYTWVETADGDEKA